MSTVVVTGITGAVGGAAARMLSQQGYNVIGTSRRPGDENFLDLSSKASIINFVEGLKARGIQVDALLNNAGTMQRDFGLNADGVERVIGTNYLGTCRLSRLMIDAMGPRLRIVNTVSISCYTAHFDKSFFNVDADSYSQVGTYAKSKYALILFSQELARRTGNPVNLTDPGVVDSRMLHMDRWFDPLADVLFRPFCKSPKGGATPAVNAIGYEGTLQIFRGMGHSDIPRRWRQPALAEWLWEETEKYL